VAKASIIDIQRLFEVTGYIEEHRVLYSSYKFTGEAAKWWQVKRDLLTLELG
jgi:hypothetical protein